MAGRQWVGRGGILGLRARFLTDPKRRLALQYDLLAKHYSLDDLGTEAFSWYDLLAMVTHLQADSNSALSEELNGPSWSVESQLLAVAADSLAVANWQRAGRRSAPKPKRIPRPWEKPKTQALGSGAIPISSFNDWWDSKRAKRKSRRRAKKPPTSIKK